MCVKGNVSFVGFVCVLNTIGKLWSVKNRRILGALSLIINELFNQFTGFLSHYTMLCRDNTV